MYHNLLPDSDFVCQLNAKIQKCWSGLESSDVHVTNVVAMNDEFVHPSRLCLTGLVETQNISEVYVPEGHCEALFHASSIGKIQELSEGPVIALHPVLYGRTIFADIHAGIKPENFKNFIPITYDYSNPGESYERYDKED